MEGECEIVLCGGVHFYCTIIVENTLNNPSTCHVLWLMGSSLKLRISSNNNRGYNMNQNRWILCSRGDLSMGLGAGLQMVSIIKKLKIHRLVFTVCFLMYGLLWDLVKVPHVCGITLLKMYKNIHSLTTRELFFLEKWGNACCGKYKISQCEQDKEDNLFPIKQSNPIAKFDF